MEITNRRYQFSQIFIILITIVIIGGCIDVVGIIQPTSISANKDAHIQLNIRITPNKAYEKIHLIFAFLTPKDWDIPNNEKIFYTSNIGSGQFEKCTGLPYLNKHISWEEILFNNYGVVDNVVSDMRWSVYRTDKAYKIQSSNTITGKIELRFHVGQNNCIVRPAFLIADDLNGLRGATLYPAKQMTVVNGLNPSVNYCKLQLVMVTPFKFTSSDQNLVITFNANATQNVLATAHVVYLHSIAFGKDHGVVKRFELNNKSKMIPIGNNSWRLSLNPANYYGIATHDIAYISYSFCDETGKTVLGAQNSKLPFIYKF